MGVGRSGTDIYIHDGGEGAGRSIDLPGRYGLSLNTGATLDWRCHGRMDEEKGECVRGGGGVG